MQTLHTGFRGRPKRRFLAAGAPTRITLEGCPGLVVHVLGPSRDEQVIQDMDPPSGQSFLRFIEEAAGHDPSEPSSKRLSAATRAARLSVHRPFQWSFSLASDAYEARWGHLAIGPELKDAARSVMRGDDVPAAVSLDKAVNGTSLMLMFEFGDAFLLFPGDAQSNPTTPLRSPFDRRPQSLSSSPGGGPTRTLSGMPLRDRSERRAPRPPAMAPTPQARRT